VNPDIIKASLSEKFALIHEHWRPKVVAQLNGQELKLVKLSGVFPWHHHEHEDELFLVWRGQMTIEFRDRRVVLEAGDFCVVRAASNTARWLRRKRKSWCLNPRPPPIPVMSWMKPLPLPTAL
jgi:quercetin dioxygenase-like cupin family protein